jgi:hypothetical protein
MKCILGNTYFTPQGKEFIPVSFERGKLKPFRAVYQSSGSRETGRYIDKDGNRIKKNNLFPDRFGDLKNGSKVSHEDYSSEIFIVWGIDKTTGIVTTKGGKNGVWINHIDLIIRK